MLSWEKFYKLSWFFGKKSDTEVARTSHSSQVSAEGDFKKEPTSPLTGRRGTNTKIGKSVRMHAPEKPNRATAALPQACSDNLETNPERGREEPRGAPHATGPGLHGEWLILDADVGNDLRVTCQHTRGNARDKSERGDCEKRCWRCWHHKERL